MNPLSPHAARLTWLSAAFVTAFCALIATVGADAHWLAALGREIVRLGSIPAGVPYAAAPSGGWENVPVLGELVFHGLEAGLGDRGLVLAQAVVVGAAFAVLALGMRRADAADAPSALVLLLVAAGSASSLLVVRAQLFSLALFPVLLGLLRSESRVASGRIWYLVPLFALWSNLHGAVLVGVAVAGAYLLLHRLRRHPLDALGVLAGSLAALLATPALLDTSRYYRGVLGSEAAESGEGLWAPLSLGKPLDVAFVLVSIPLLALAVRSRPALWEVVALVGLVVMAFQAGRNGVWLLFFLAAPAACGLTGRRVWRLKPPRRLTAVLAGSLAALLVLGLLRTPPPSVAGEALREQATRAAGGSPILADDVNAERLALDGRRVWIANPLDAFDRRDQRLYLDWIAARPGGDRLAARFPAALVTLDSPVERRLAGAPGWREAGRDDRAVLYVRAR